MSNETLILVPGLNCTADLFSPQIAVLHESRPVVVADHTLDDTIEDIARRVLVETPGLLAVAGLSMGGYVALEVMRQAPERVARLALLDTSARADTEEARARRLEQIALAETGHFADVKAQLWPRLVHPDRLEDRGLKQIVLSMMDETGPETFVRQQRAIMGRHDARSWLSQVEIPTLVVVGDGDAITPPEHAREMAEMVEWASLVVVPDCGHLSSLERPEPVIAAMRAWLAG